jgi:hypothetical protein
LQAVSTNNNRVFAFIICHFHVPFHSLKFTSESNGGELSENKSAACSVSQEKFHYAGFEAASICYRVSQQIL